MKSNEETLDDLFEDEPKKEEPAKVEESNGASEKTEMPTAQSLDNMFDNISQGLFTTGATGYLIVVPVLRSLAILFMVISTYILSSGLYKVIFSPFYYILKKILRLDNELFSVFLLSRGIKIPNGTNIKMFKIILRHSVCEKSFHASL